MKPEPTPAKVKSKSPQKLENHAGRVKKEEGRKKMDISDKTSGSGSDSGSSSDNSR